MNLISIHMFFQLFVYSIAFSAFFCPCPNIFWDLLLTFFHEKVKYLTEKSCPHLSANWKLLGEMQNTDPCSGDL